MVVVPDIPNRDTYWPANVPRQLDLPDGTVDANLDATAARCGDRVAIHYQGRALTYSDLLDRVVDMAGYLQSIGVEKGDRVLLYMQNSPQYVISYYGILRAGAAVVPVNPMNRHGELEYLAQDTGAKVIILGLDLADNALPLLAAGDLIHAIGAAYQDMADPLYDPPLPKPLTGLSESGFSGRGCIGFGAALALRLAPRAREIGPGDIAVVPYSSGTTGQPKGCVHTHFSVMVTAVGNQAWNPADDGDVFLATLPFFHVTGMQNSMNTPIYMGGTVVILPRWDCATAAILIERFKVARWRSITTMAIDLVNHPDLDSFDLSSLKAIGGGGAAMPEAIAQRLKSLLGLDYVEGYGLSEAMGATHMNPADAPKDQCLGVPVFGVDCRILDPQGFRELPHGDAGEIVTHAPQVFREYWNKPGETAQAFVEIDGKQFLRTGDIGFRDTDGYFFMVDRVKRMINASGFKVWPAEVEALMHHHPDIAEVCVVRASDPRSGELVKAYVVLAAHSKTRDAAALIDWCRQEMAAYKCPRVIEFTETLPKSGSGKVLWRELS